MPTEPVTVDRQGNHTTIRPYNTGQMTDGFLRLYRRAPGRGIWIIAYGPRGGPHGSLVLSTEVARAVHGELGRLLEGQ